LEIYLAFQQWKNFENPLRIDKVIAMSSVCSYFWPTLYDVSNGAIFNDLERPLPSILRSRHSLTLNISETVQHADLVSMEY